MLRKILKIVGWVLFTVLLLFAFGLWRNWDTVQRVFLGGLKVYETDAPTLPNDIKRPAILVFSKTNAFRHEEAIPAANALLDALAPENGWGIYKTENGAAFSPAILARFDAIVFSNTSGDVFTPDQRAAFKGFVENGGGRVGIHAAKDSEHPYTTPKDRSFAWIRGYTSAGAQSRGDGKATACPKWTSRQTGRTASAATGRSATTISPDGTIMSRSSSGSPDRTRVCRSCPTASSSRVRDERRRELFKATVEARFPGRKVIIGRIANLPVAQPHHEELGRTICQNRSLTYMALSARAADHAARLLTEGQL